ncbi:putative Fatty acid desaturase domain-containing protein [Seiridium cardinale]|uniref:Fatty acid desaturase domain-containing protein n=1 Tax=Seiridium cardinale TaxID=138064 RepID=A0ABR2XY74_9PEZI
MDKYIVYDAALTKADRLVLKALAADVETQEGVGRGTSDLPQGRDVEQERNEVQALSTEDEGTLSYLNGLNDPTSPDFEPTVFQGVDYDGIHWKKPFNQYVLKHYVRIAKSIVRVDTDVVMLTHLLLYFSTSVPSAIYLFFGTFTWIHGVLHFLMQISYMGAYTLMMHQHIHMRGIFHKSLGAFDHLFPYLLDPLMGHTWNSYFYHHVKHHHVEGNGPDDLSSTMRYQRDSLPHFLHYFGRFLLFVWLELPLYFFSKKRFSLGAKTGFWELSSYAMLYSAYKYNPQAAICVLLLPLALMRFGMMIGNWGQHAFVDPDEPDSDYRSSITLIDVPSNRYSFNDGYHTSHHLNPLRHWREHPNSFLKSRHIYASQNALVFHNLDYIMLTVKLLTKDYKYLAERMVPIGEPQLAMTLEERMAHLKSRTQRFTEEDLKLKYD